ncbi:hypothetical protein ACHWQZ_G011460 [Mnemiopsis leidyi]
MDLDLLYLKQELFQFGKLDTSSLYKRTNRSTNLGSQSDKHRGVLKKMKYLSNLLCTPSVFLISASISDFDEGFNVEKVDSSTKSSQSFVELSFDENSQTHYSAGFPF